MAEASPNRTAGVLETLRDEILTGQYRPGERLPSERELAARFGTSRGAVREALKKLEQLGIAAIHPGGVRVQSLEEASLDVIGPLLDLQDVPDALLVDQVATIIGVLVTHAAETAARTATDAQIAEARAQIARVRATDLRDPQSLELRMGLGQIFMRISGNLAVRLIANSLRLNFADRLRERGITPTPDAAEFEIAIDALDAALAARDGDAVRGSMRALMQLNRHAIATTLEAAGASRRGLDLVPAPPSRGLPA